MVHFLYVHSEVPMATLSVSIWQLFFFLIKLVLMSLKILLQIFGNLFSLKITDLKANY